MVLIRCCVGQRALSRLPVMSSFAARPPQRPSRRHQSTLMQLATPSPEEGVFMTTAMKRTLLVKDAARQLDRKVTLCGWVTHSRFVGKDRIFLVLRDHSETIQLYLSPEKLPTFAHVAEQLRQLGGALEAVVSVRGTIAKRPTAQANPQMMTGDVEVIVEGLTVLNAAVGMAFLPHSLPLPEEDFRLRHRPIDLRRSELQRNLHFRASLNQEIRSFMQGQGFVEVETPILFKSTPEGAREFLVPADRIAPGKAFALPQSPQQFKQMLMAGGLDRYYQIARCFRDEDLRADRQPEFTQLDMEMSFVTMPDVMAIMESLVKHLWRATLGVQLPDPFPHITYAESLATYGTDKPDMRYRNVLPIRQISSDGDRVEETLNLDGAPLDEQECRALARLAQELATRSDGGRISSISGPSTFLSQFAPSLSTSESPVIALRASRRLSDHVGTTALGRVRGQVLKMLRDRGSLSDEPAAGSSDSSSKWAFLWVTDFPLLASRETASEQNAPYPSKYESMHHPFTAPHPEDLGHFAEEPLRVRGQHYDLVLNGCEVGGGSIRIHSAALQEYILRHVIKLSDQHIEHFRHLLDALRSGCPPHGGMALGLDRLAAIMCGAQSIRDVVAFPKNSAGYDLCVGSPN